MHPQYTFSAQMDNLAFFDRACRCVNAAAFNWYGLRSSCVFSSVVLLDVLTRLGIAAEPMRVRAVVFGEGRGVTGCVLGSDGDGTRLPAVGRDNWRGHLIVVAGHVALDPTLDQVNDNNPLLGAEPMTFPVTDAWLAGDDSVTMPTGDCGSIVRYLAYPGRGGFKDAGDFRPRRRRDVVATVLAQLAED